MRAAITRPVLLSVLLSVLLLFTAAPAVATDVRYTVPAGDSPSIGPANAPVTLVEFVDYQ